MNILDRFFVGKIIKDFGMIEERSSGFGRFRKRVLLAEKRGELRLALKSSATAFLSGSVSYFDLGMDALPRLRQYIDEAERIAASRANVPR